MRSGHIVYVTARAGESFTAAELATLTQRLAVALARSPSRARAVGDTVQLIHDPTTSPTVANLGWPGNLTPITVADVLPANGIPAADPPPGTIRVAMPGLERIFIRPNELTGCKVTVGYGAPSSGSRWSTQLDIQLLRNPRPQSGASTQIEPYLEPGPSPRGAGPLQRWEARLDLGFEGGVLVGADIEASMDRWVRVLLGRTVGLALSGGGALAYFHAALIDALADRDVAFDHIAGISGGALVGAYATVFHPTTFLSRLEADAWRNQFSALKSVFKAVTGLGPSNPIEAGVDRNLGGARIEAQERVFLAVTRPFELDSVPGVVKQGPFGMAVSLSGALPVAFAPVAFKGTRYIDGVAGDAVPALALMQYGSDFVIQSVCFAKVGLAGQDKLNEVLDTLAMVSASGSRYGRGSKDDMYAPQPSFTPFRLRPHLAWFSASFSEARRMIEFFRNNLDQSQLDAIVERYRRLAENRELVWQ